MWYGVVMILKTIPGVTYVVSSATACSVTAVMESGAPITLCSVAAGGQKAFQAISMQTEVTSANAAVVPYDRATVPLGMQGGCDADQVAQMVQSAVSDPVEEEAVTGDGGENADARYAQTAGKFVPDAELLGVSIKCRSNSNDVIATGPLFLGVWEKNETGGGYTRMGSSVAAVAQVAGETKKWTFEGLRLHGRTVRLAFLTSRDELWPSSWDSRIMGVSCAAREASDTESLLASRTGQQTNFLASVTFTFLGYVPKFAPYGGGGGDAEGVKGDKGDPGPYFTPSVSEDGVLSWTNNGGLVNPPNVTIKGADGATGLAGPSGPAGPAGPAGKDAELTEKQTTALQFVQDNQTKLQGLLDSSIAYETEAVALGEDAKAHQGSVAIGYKAEASTESIAIGSYASSLGQNSIALGNNYGATERTYKATAVISVGTMINHLVLLIWGPESELAPNNTEGESGIGFIEYNTGKKGCIKLSKLLTSPFELPTT